MASQTQHRLALGQKYLSRLKLTERREVIKAVRQSNTFFDRRAAVHRIAEYAQDAVIFYVQFHK